MHILVLAAKADCEIPRIVPELPLSWELELCFSFFLMRVSSVAEITVILIYLSVSVSKSRDGMLKRLHVPSFSGFY